MKQILTARLSQQITLTPQLQQAIRLLQLSAQDLSEEIQKALESNPLLEATADSSEAEGAESTSVEAESQSIETLTVSIADKLPETSEEQTDYSLEENYQQDWRLPSSNTYNQDGGDQPMLELRDNHSNTLQQHLLWQMRLTPFSALDMAIATAIIDAIAEDGYLKTSLDEIHASLDRLDVSVERDEIEAVLKRIQRFEPLGVGSQNLQDFLILQLEELPPTTPYRDTALEMVKAHIELLASRDYRQLKQRLKATEDQISHTIQLIKSLNPRPNYEICEEQPEYIIPDVVVYKRAGAWQLELNQKVTPSLHINRNYATLLRDGRNEVQYQQLKDQLQEARWLLKSLASRNETLLKVARCIVERQHNFFEHGPTAMKPMILQDIAQETELHESTVSRITTQKYMQTPMGIFELKYFFSSHLHTHHGEECSSTAIRAFIKRLVNQEMAEKPLSDNQIALALESKQGVKIARRTITKYREALGILSSNERKRAKRTF